MHITHELFGVGLINRYDLLMTLLEDIDTRHPAFRELSGFDQAYIVRESYDTIFNIVDPASVDPLSYVAVNDVEGLYELSGYDKRLDQYCRARVLKNMGITFIDLLKLPRHEVIIMIDKCNELEASESKITEAQEAKVQAQLRDIDSAANNKPSEVKFKTPQRK